MRSCTSHFLSEIKASEWVSSTLRVKYRDARFPPSVSLSR